MTDCLRSHCLVKLRGSAHLVALGLVSMMLLCMIFKPVGLVKRCARQTALERQNLSRTYLAHHELESIVIVIVVIIIINTVLTLLLL